MRRIAALAHYLATLLVICTAAASAQFEQRVSVAVQDPGPIAVADFNGDGNLDLATVNAFATQVAIMLGNRNGTFKPPVYYSAGDNPVALAVSDLNHDGKLDLVVGNYLSSNVSVLLGNGDGTFQAPVNYTIPYGSALWVGVGDFNNDGNPDITAIDLGLCSTGTMNCIVIFLGNGDGSFQTESINTYTDWDLIGGFAIGDFNGDGNLDLAVPETFESSGQTQIFLGNGDGTFRPGAAYSPVGHITAAALTRTRNLDLILANGGAMEVLLGNGDGTFRGPTAYPPFVSWTAVADFNGDGIPDIAETGVNTGNQALLYLGNGDGTFQAAKTYATPPDAGFIEAGDFNGDHKPDIVFAAGRNPSYTITTMLNTGVVTFSPTTPLNFKKVKVGTTSAPLTVALTNTGKSALTISSMKTTGQFAMTSTCGSSVPAGANCSLSVTFSPTSTGPKSGTVTIHDSASSKPQVIELTGTGD